MATIVQHRRTGNQYILLSINGEANQGNPSRFISELFNQEKSGVSCSATICDVQGNIFLVYIEDILVVEIDGIKPAEILPEVPYKNVNDATQWDEPPLSRSPSESGVQSPDIDLEAEDETEFESAENDNFPTIQPITVDSLDAPKRNSDSDDEDWI